MKKACFIVGTLIILLAVVAFGFACYYLNSHFMPDSHVDYGFGVIDSEFKTTDAVAQDIMANLRRTQYRIKDSEGNETSFYLEDVVDTFKYTSFMSAVKDMKAVHGRTEREFQVDVEDLIVFNKDKIEKIIDDIKLDAVVESTDAYITFNEETKTYNIVPEKIGNIMTDDVVDKVYFEVSSFNYDINLSTLGCYVLPKVYQDNDILVSNLEQYKKYESFNLTYLFGDTKETIDILQIYKNLIEQYSNETPELLNPETPLVLDEYWVDEYVAKLNEKYTTYGKLHNFTTSTGETIQITKGDYGWILNVDKMREDIISHFSEIKSEEKEAIFKQKAYCFGESDFSDSYVEVSIENQRVWMYVNGECIVDTPVVTGNISAGHNTRKGIFSLTYKTRNATLRGADYASFVYYWMPFDGGIGLHDATWRSSFGGNIYKTNGSHGCVNMPLEAAKTVYNNLESNMPIIVW